MYRRKLIITDKIRNECSVHLSEDQFSVVILDQTQLPNRQVYLTLNTAVNLSWAVRRMLGVIRDGAGRSIDELKELL